MKAFILIITLVTAYAASGQSLKSREHYLHEIKDVTHKIESDKDNLTLYYARGTFHKALNNFTSSNEDFKKVVDLYAANPSKKLAKAATDACYYLADDFYFRNADRISAQAYINRGLDISPGDKRFEVLQVGIMGSYPEKAKEAGKRFEELIAKHPDDEKLLLYYAKFLERSDLEKSTKLYEKVIEINPVNVPALFALGAYYANEATRIYNANGDAGKVLDYMQKGVGFFERVHRLIPHDDEIIEILIQFYGHLNRHEDQKKMERKLSKQGR